MDDDDLMILVSHQQQELMAAAALESDSDFAFRIQLEEAMHASLLGHSQNPSATTAASSPTPLSALVNLESDPADSELVKLQSLELERFQQERKDRELSEAEMRRVSFDIKRRVHDSNFAREIVEMPVCEWENYGDNFEKPIDAGCSSSSFLVDIDVVFKVYFKGLMSLETVGSRFYNTAAVGIAIYDPLDQLVLKVQKPLYGVEMSRKVVEFQALIEGLNAALSLNLKHVEVFTDYTTLFKHVTGRWAVKQRKIANLLDRIRPLQSKFSSCNMHVLPRCDCSYVIKLAREAIAQLMQRIEGQPDGDTHMKETCIICLENVESSQVFVGDGCLHRFCFSCMKQHVEVKLLHGVLPGCPHEGCKTMLNADSCKKFLSPKTADIMAQRLKEASIPEADRLYCPYPKCSALMSRNEMMLPPGESSSVHCANYGSGCRKCIKCQGLFCLNCKVPWHLNMSCVQYKKLHPHPLVEDAKLQSLARQKLWRQCIKCNHMIELAEGCYHMTCRCGHEFCYTCGAEWKDKKATCSCPLWTEENIWRDRDDSEESDYGSEEEYYDSDWDEEDRYF